MLLLSKPKTKTCLCVDSYNKQSRMYAKKFNAAKFGDVDPTSNLEILN